MPSERPLPPIRAKLQTVTGGGRAAPPQYLRGAPPRPPVQFPPMLGMAPLLRQLMAHQQLAQQQGMMVNQLDLASQRQAGQTQFALSKLDAVQAQLTQLDNELTEILSAPSQGGPPYATPDTPLQ